MYMCGFSSRSKFVTTKDSNDVRLDFFFFSNFMWIWEGAVLQWGFLLAFCCDVFVEPLKWKVLSQSFGGGQEG